MYVGLAYNMLSIKLRGTLYGALEQKAIRLSSCTLYHVCLFEDSDWMTDTLIRFLARCEQCRDMVPVHTAVDSGTQLDGNQ